MQKSQYNKHLEQLCAELIVTAKAGQTEYALSEDAFDNFNRLGSLLGLDRKYVLWVYLQKHLDGIVSYIKGHKSQRESVHGRIKDAIVYLTILDAMVYENDNGVGYTQEPSPDYLNPNQYTPMPMRRE
jgi:hypothetical protein